METIKSERLWPCLAMCPSHDNCDCVSGEERGNTENDKDPVDMEAEIKNVKLRFCETGRRDTL